MLRYGHQQDRVTLPLSNLTGLSSWYLATLNASMEIDVSEIKGNSEIQTSVSLHWDRAGGKLAWCAVNVSQSTEYYPPTVPWLWAVRTRVVFEANNAKRYNSQRATQSAWINHSDLSFFFFSWLKLFNIYILMFKGFHDIEESIKHFNFN